MVYEQEYSPSAAKQNGAFGAETTQQGAPPASLPGQLKEQPRTRLAGRPRKRGLWHYLGLLLAGLCCCTLLVGLATVIWCIITYIRLGYITGELLPLLIFLGAIFLSSCLITALARGGTIFPALLFTLLANVLSLLLAELSWPLLSGILIKLGFSLLTTVIGFALTKLLIQTGQVSKRR